MKLKIKTEIEIIVPNGTKVIRNDTWLTLARKTRSGHVDLITVPIEEVGATDFTNENQWNEFTKDELRKSLNVL